MLQLQDVADVGTPSKRQRTAPQWQVPSIVASSTREIER
jgi:hypothetical protein